MPTMSRPALDVKGGTSPVKEVTSAILQMGTLRHGKTAWSGPCEGPSHAQYLVSFSREEIAGLSQGRMRIASASVWST